MDWQHKWRSFRRGFGGGIWQLWGNRKRAAAEVGAHWSAVTLWLGTRLVLSLIMFEWKTPLGPCIPFKESTWDLWLSKLTSGRYISTTMKLNLCSIAVSETSSRPNGISTCLWFAIFQCLRPIHANATIYPLCKSFNRNGADWKTVLSHDNSGRLSSLCSNKCVWHMWAKLQRHCVFPVQPCVLWRLCSQTACSSGCNNSRKVAQMSLLRRTNSGMYRRGSCAKFCGRKSFLQPFRRRLMDHLRIQWIRKWWEIFPFTGILSLLTHHLLPLLLLLLNFNSNSSSKMRLLDGVVFVVLYVQETKPNSLSRSCGQPQ